MFTRLPESNAKRQRRTGGLVVSTVLHLVVIAFAVQASGLTAAPTPTTERVDSIFYKAPPPDAPPPTASPITRQPSTSTDMPAIPAPPDLPSVVTPDIPSTLPDPGAMHGLLEGFDRPRVSLAGPPGASPNVSDGAALPESLVEKAVIAIPGTATPRYPSMLQSAGVDGDVRAQFVVDTLGRVEQGSFKVLQSSHDLFAAAVRDALGRARFKPAEAGGHRVRQLVEQTFTFSITR